jgi:hypothetical protein
VDKWARSVGAFVINFGNAEMVAFQWIAKHSPNPVADRDSAIDMKLAKRIEFVCRLIQNSALPEDRKKKAIALWRELDKYRKIRNIIAHSPFLASTQNGKREDGFIDVRRMKGKGPYKLEPMMLEDVRAAGKAVALVLEQIAVPF